jgi:spore coat protein A
VNMRLVNRQSFDLVGYQLANPRPAIGTRWAPVPDRFLLCEPQAPQPWESGMKDTVACPQNMVTRFLVQFPRADELGFDPDAPFPAPPGANHGVHGSHGGERQLQGYVWHCHILDHEDDCMMARYRLQEK